MRGKWEIRNRTKGKIGCFLDCTETSHYNFQVGSRFIFWLKIPVYIKVPCGHVFPTVIMANSKFVGVKPIIPSLTQRTPQREVTLKEA